MPIDAKLREMISCEFVKRTKTDSNENNYHCVIIEKECYKFLMPERCKTRLNEVSALYRLRKNIEPIVKNIGLRMKQMARYNIF